MDTASHWNQLHNQPRFRPIYPSEHVVRFLMANRGLLENKIQPRFLDIGLGAGRHMKLAEEMGFAAFGVDISLAGLEHARQRLLDAGRAPLVALSSFRSLPFQNSCFQLVLSFGVFYYGNADDMQQGIADAHRVLAPRGKLFAVLRTLQDYRYGKGEKIAPNTFRLAITDTNECGTIQHFLASDDIPSYFRAFRNVNVEKTETTFGNRNGVNSDWLITATK